MFALALRWRFGPCSGAKGGGNLRHLRCGHSYLATPPTAPPEPRRRPNGQPPVAEVGDRVPVTPQGVVVEEQVPASPPRGEVGDRAAGRTPGGEGGSPHPPVTPGGCCARSPASTPGGRCTRSPTSTPGGSVHAVSYINSRGLPVRAPGVFCKTSQAAREERARRRRG